MRAALVIAGKDLRLRIRDRSALMMSIAAPLGLAVLFSTMIPNQDTFHAAYAIVDLDGGPIASALLQGPVAGLGSSGVASLETLTSEADARARVEAGDADAAVIIPAGFSDAVQAGEPATLRIVAGPSTLPSEILRSVLTSFGDDVAGVQVAVATVLHRASAAPDPSAAAEIAAAAVSQPAPVALSAVETADRVATTTTYYAASMAVMFVFFAAQVGVVGILAERRAGTLARMLATPIRPSTILAGKVLVSMAMATLSVTVMIVATTLLLGARWGDPVAVAVLALAIAFAATGIATLLVGFAHTEDQASSLVAIVGMTLAVLGGSMFRISQAPEGLASLSVLTPHAWFLRAIDDLAGGGGPAIVLPSVAVLLAVGLVTGGVGLVRARRIVA